MNRCLAAAAAALVLAAGANAEELTHTFDLSGLTSNGSFFEVFPSIQHNFGVPGEVTLVEFDVNYESHDPSWQSETIMWVDGSADGLGDYDLFVAGDYGAPDEPGFFSYSDSAVVSIQSLDGWVSITLSEAYDDDIDPDATYGEGSYLTVHYTSVPAPGALALLGLGGAFAGRRRR